MDENEISKVVLDAAMKIHRALGPGLFENVYESLMEHELVKAGLRVKRQVALPLEFEGLRFEEAYRVDLLVEDKVLVELKSIERLHPIHRKQLLTYLKLHGAKLGLLLNFGGEMMRDGVERVVNGLAPSIPVASFAPIAPLRDS
ncbi:MAG TPA: GxxExxY protein [Solimonas sp.]|nr:GxxExxY protein [Solimonas sp.]